MTRRELLLLLGKSAAAVPLLGRRTWAKPGRSPAISRADEQLLEGIQRAGCAFFWEQGSPTTGQVKDRALGDGNDNRRMSSIAATGFGLAALCIADARRFRPAKEIQERVRATLKWLFEKAQHEHGFFYHFFDMETGALARNTELSSIDTSILLCGALTCRQHFRDREIADLATKIYQRVEWPWMLNAGDTFSMGWKQETGFIKARWDTYSELMMLYLLAIGSPSHPAPPELWYKFNRPTIEYGGLTYISTRAPLFIHQYSHAFYDFRDRHDRYANYFDNSVRATQAHKKFCLSLKDRFPDYSEDLWGITSSDSAHGYVAWGGPPEMGRIDGSIVPAAAAGSLPFLPAECLQVLRTIRGKFGDKVWKRYGFADAFNPLTGWVNPDVIGIDVGITVLMAENLRSGMVWETFMKNPEAYQAMEKAGFKRGVMQMVQ
jgi:hypothetical protein